MSDPDVDPERLFYLWSAQDVFDKRFKEKRMTALEWFCTVDPLSHEACPTLNPLRPDEVECQKAFHAKMDRFFAELNPRHGKARNVELLCELATQHALEWCPTLPECIKMGL